VRKRLITRTPQSIRTHGPGWLDTERAAVVEVTSEDKDFPVEASLVSGDSRGWRAAIPGSQTIRLVFVQPQGLRCISVVLKKRKLSGPKSSSCAGLTDGRSSLKEIVRQQWNFQFSPDSIRSGRL
jgi:hypothetical protein